METKQAIEIVKVLLKNIGDDPEQNKTLAAGCIVLLDDVMTGKTETKPAKPKAAPKKRKPFDTGKMKALLNGGWTVEKIAEELDCSQATVYDHMKKEGITR